MNINFKIYTNKIYHFVLNGPGDSVEMLKFSISIKKKFAREIRLDYIIEKKRVSDYFQMTLKMYFKNFQLFDFDFSENLIKIAYNIQNPHKTNIIYTSVDSARAHRAN